jgi:hypothetical protein
MLLDKDSDEPDDEGLSQGLRLITQREKRRRSVQKYEPGASGTNAEIEDAK